LVLQQPRAKRLLTERAAEELASTGRRYIFRGQSKDWPVSSRFTRLDKSEKPLAKKQVERFEGWVGMTPGFEKLASDVDQLLAVAQHYGIPTTFVDFTTEPRIAGYFASEKVSPDTSSDLACIVCLDVDDLLDFWKSWMRDSPHLCVPKT
jgi:hypothetical protein